MKIVLFVNDSYFSYLLSKLIIEKFHDRIEAVVFSTRIKGSVPQLIEVFKKTHWRYYIYRSTVQIITFYNAFFNRKTVLSLVKHYNLRTFNETDVNNSANLMKILPSDLALAFNFDQILKNELLKLFRKGVINVHASRLPRDKGVSPVLWAFARGDNMIWSTIYKMDGGLDTGTIYKQFEVPVKKDDTAFSLYERVCAKSGEELVTIVDYVFKDAIESIPQSDNVDSNYWSWPDRTHKKLMKESKRKFIKFVDIIRALRKRNI